MADPPTGKEKGAAESTKFWKQALGSPENNKERKEESGVYVGEGLPPIPMKLAQRIWQWEFIDMAKMLPELWARRGDDNLTRDPTTRVRRPITDLKTWLKAFATYVAVMSQKNGGAVPELMTYMVSIIRAEEEYAEGVGCTMMWLIANRQQHTGTQPGQKYTPHFFHYALQARRKLQAVVTSACRAHMEPGSVSGWGRESRICQRSCMPWKPQ